MKHIGAKVGMILGMIGLLAVSIFLVDETVNDSNNNYNGGGNKTKHRRNKKRKNTRRK